ncbi:MAG: DUF2268 domain-containing putative Zn-dependent protease [Pseudomonadota bacterium]
MVWTVHYLNARAALDPVLPQINRTLVATEERLAKVVTLPRLDLVVQATPGFGIPQLGHVGHAPRAGVIMLSFDPENPNMRRNLDGPLSRMIAHEIHHALRWDAAHYGRTLGEALVSEGLAGQFVREVYGTEPEPWECAIDDSLIPTLAGAALREWADPEYDHARWFFGSGHLPNWAGYSLGYAMAHLWLAGTQGARASTAADIPADALLPALTALAREEQMMRPVFRRRST